MIVSLQTLDAKQQATYVSDVRQAVRFAMLDMKGNADLLPGFCLPKGIAPILPIFREAILNGDGDEKEAAAQGLGEVIKLTSAPALQPSVVHITGPLIRILGDRFSSNVKTAVLETLAILLAKVRCVFCFVSFFKVCWLQYITSMPRNTYCFGILWENRFPELF